MNKIKVILFAAGMGKRIASDIDYGHKALLKINETTILKRMVKLFNAKGCKIVVCTGYEHNRIESELSEYDIRYYYNPFYSVSNNIGSLWFARNELDGESDLIFASTDLVISEEIVDFLWKSKEKGIIMYGDSMRILSGDYYLKTKNNYIVSYGPDLPINERDFEYIGITKVSCECVRIIREQLEAMIEEGKIQEYYERVFLSFINDKKIAPQCRDVCGLPWYEIDTIDDYKKAIKAFG